MICTVIQNKNLEGVLEALDHCEMAEIRLDRCSLSEDDIRVCFCSDVPTVATCRVQEVMDSNPTLNEAAAARICERRLTTAIVAGASYVDLELEAPYSLARRIRKAALENGTVFIRSYHNFGGTDSSSSLAATQERCLRDGADIVKIVTMASDAADVERVMGLYDDAVPGTLIAFCMGPAGMESRLDCLRRGAPYTYAAAAKGDEAASGQWTAEDMHRKIYGDFHFIGDGPARDASTARDGSVPSLEGRTDGDGSRSDESRSGGPIRIPSSKSFAQRAVIAAALAEGTSHLSGYSPCGDNEAALRVAEAVGAEISREADVLTVKGIGAAPQCAGFESLDVGESGLLTRLMIPISSLIASSEVTLTGEKTLLSRPMKGVGATMAQFGVTLENLPAAAATSPTTAADSPTETPPAGQPAAGTAADSVLQLGPEDCLVPLKIAGPLTPARARISGKEGSQIISGLLMALPMAQRNSVLTVNDPKSIPYMFITLDVMKKFGVKVANEMMGGRPFVESGGDWAHCTDIEFKVRGGQKYKAADFAIEGDWSSAANFLVAGAIFGRAEISSLDTTSLQADLSIMDILMEAGASLSQLDEPTGPVTAARSPLNAFTVDATNCPDLFPIISVLAAFCQGKSVIRGTDRLVHKESDRGRSILEMLERMGVEAEIKNDTLTVHGRSLTQRLLTGTLLKGGKYSSYHDHRMVMALKVAELGADSPFEIDDTDCVAKSFPSFFELFDKLKQAR